MRSPDVSDGFVLRFARKFTDRLPENVVYEEGMSLNYSGGPIQQNNDEYERRMYGDTIEAQYRRV